MAETQPLPHGVRLVEFETHPDHRGRFTEIFRDEWNTGIEPIQWNAVLSEAGVMRGVHLHPLHRDYLVIADGRATVGLRDLRRGSPTEGATALVALSGDAMSGLQVPPGVAHGTLFLDRSILVYAASHYYSEDDELECHWADPALEIDWPQAPTVLSRRDAEAPGLSDLLVAIEPFQPFV
jgi:dTDP-4-dehydrorhamnose 3,5-epimerase